MNRTLHINKYKVPFIFFISRPKITTIKLGAIILFQAVTKDPLINKVNNYINSTLFIIFDLSQTIF